MARANFDSGRINCALREGANTAEKIFEKHCHPRYELIAVLEGRVGVIAEGKKAELSCGEVAIIPPLCYHSIYTDAGNNYRRITALFDKELIPCEIFDDFEAKSRERFTVSHSTLSALLDELRAALLEDEVNKFSALIESLALQVLYIYTYKELEGEEESTHPRVRRITEYIDAHICEKICLSDIADALFLSPSTVSHVFKEEMKISVKQYVLQKKLSFAAKLISEGVPAALAAERIGYENYANFYKMYKQLFGRAPSARL